MRIKGGRCGLFALIQQCIFNVDKPCFSSTVQCHRVAPATDAVTVATGRR